MKINSARFNLTPTEKARIKTFEREIWYNSELCNHCFSRVREIEVNYVARRLSKTTLKNHPAAFHERTPLGTQEHHVWDYNQRFGTCFCLECGGDLSASHRDLPREKMKEYGKSLARYAENHTALQFDTHRFFRELLRLKDRRDTQGKETQIFAVAFARAIQTSTGADTGGDTPTEAYPQPAD